MTRFYPSVLTQNVSRMSDGASEGYSKFSQQTPDRNSLCHPTSRRPKMREGNGVSFLQRLLEIERRHDEKRMMHQKAAAKTYPEINKESVDEHNLAFPRSPTRWLSEQIFDDTQEMTNFVHDSNDSFSKASYSRLPSLSDVHRISSIANNDSSSAFLPPKQTSATTSLTSLSYVELSQSDDFSNRPQVRKRPLRLPPILLPPIYTVRPRPLKERDFLTPTNIRGPITDEEWEDLHRCRYIRPAPSRFDLTVRSSQIS